MGSGEKYQGPPRRKDDLRHVSEEEKQENFMRLLREAAKAGAEAEERELRGWGLTAFAAVLVKLIKNKFRGSKKN